MNRQEKIKISNLGLGIAIAGIISIPLAFMPINLFILSWIDFFGEGVGWGIRILLIIIGLTLYYKYDLPAEE
jgi:hypothetical protein